MKTVVRSKTMAKKKSMRVIFSVMLFCVHTWPVESCRNGAYPENSFALVDHVYKLFLVDDLVSCYISCTAEPACQSLNYNPVDKTCELNNETKCFQPNYFVKKPGFLYVENPGSGKLRYSFFLFTKYASLCINFLCSSTLSLVSINPLYRQFSITKA